MASHEKKPARAKKPQRRKPAVRAGKGAVPTLRFLGATETVTGSRFLVETPSARVLVDCGLFQGLKELRERNWAAFPVDPATIDAVVITHAHVDHVGYLPALVKNGFKGSVHATAGTCALCEIVLPDSGHLQEEDAAYANRRGFSKHAPALPLYTEADARSSLALFREVDFGRREEVADQIYATFRHAGHILGAASVTLELAGSAARTIVFSGDLGRSQHPILKPPEAPAAADFVLVESTYGNRRHQDVESLALFEKTLEKTLGRGGMVVIPSFAVDRTEIILFHLGRLMRDGQVPNAPVWVDSPMALSTLKIYRSALGRHSPEMRSELAVDADPFDPGNLIEAHKTEESIAINDEDGPGVIISASGMATGGRVLHHLAHRLPDKRDSVVLVGYQAAGTRGRALVDGAHSVKMHGRYVPVRADIVNVPAFSVHADQAEIVEWLSAARQAPEVVFVVHGEAEAAGALHDAIEEKLGWTAVVPRYGELVRLD